jgi:hypothetical protein
MHESHWKLRNWGAPRSGRRGFHRFRSYQSAEAASADRPAPSHYVGRQPVVATRARPGIKQHLDLLASVSGALECSRSGQRMRNITRTSRSRGTLRWGVLGQHGGLSSKVWQSDCQPPQVFFQHVAPVATRKSSGTDVSVAPVLHSQFVLRPMPKTHPLAQSQHGTLHIERCRFRLRGPGFRTHGSCTQDTATRTCLCPDAWEH